MTQCAIFDIDGTLSDSRHRDHLRPAQNAGDWSKFLADDVVINDLPIPISWAVLRGIAQMMPVVFVSGRYERQRNVTETWLRKCGSDLELNLSREGLRLRPDGDRTRSSLLKGQVLAALKGEGYRPVFAAEDNDYDANMYAAAGLSVFRCRSVKPVKPRARVLQTQARRIYGCIR